MSSKEWLMQKGISKRERNLWLLGTLVTTVAIVTLILHFHPEIMHAGISSR